MGSRNEVTIYDIAKVLDLSASTISRALSGSELVHKQTRLKISQVANELGYRRNFFIKRSKPKKTRLFGALVTQLSTTVASCVVSGAEETASALGYGVVVSQTMNDPGRRAGILDALTNHLVDGILVTSAYSQEYASLGQVEKLKIPLVVVEASSFLPSRPKKQITDFENAYELTNCLIEQGCRRIAYLSADLEKTRHANLLSGYHEALQHSSLAEADKFVLNANDFQNSWVDMCRVLISMTPCPDGIIISNPTITAIAYSDSKSSSPGGNRKEFWLTCRKGNVSSQSRRLVELGKIAAGLLICLSESMYASSVNINSVQTDSSSA